MTIHVQRYAEIARTLRGLDATNKYLIYTILLEKREATISELQKELENRFNVNLAYASIESLLNKMQEAGIIKIISGERPKKVVLKKEVKISVRDL